MLSREHYLQALQSPFEDVNYIYQFSSIPTFRKVVMTLDLKICSIHFCDHFSQSSLSSYTPRSSYRFSVPFLDISEVGLHHSVNDRLNDFLSARKFVISFSLDILIISKMHILLLSWILSLVVQLVLLRLIFLSWHWLMSWILFMFLIMMMLL